MWRCFNEDDGGAKIGDTFSKNVDAHRSGLDPRPATCQAKPPTTVSYSCAQSMYLVDYVVKCWTSLLDFVRNENNECPIHNSVKGLQRRWWEGAKTGEKCSKCLSRTDPGSIPRFGWLRQSSWLEMHLCRNESSSMWGNPDRGRASLTIS